MTLPATKPISLEQIRAEFSAPAGTPLSAFVRGGAYVPDTAQNAGVPTAKPIALTDLLGASAVVPQFSWDGSSNFTETGVGTVSARLFFEPDGTGSDDFASGNFSGWWDPKPTAGIGTGKFIRWTKISGDDLNLGSGQGSWVSLGPGSPSFGMSTGSGTIRSGTFNVEFSNNGSTVEYTKAGVIVTVDAT